MQSFLNEKLDYVTAAAAGDVEVLFVKDNMTGATGQRSLTSTEAIQRYVGVNDHIQNGITNVTYRLMSALSTYKLHLHTVTANKSSFSYMPYK